MKGLAAPAAAAHARETARPDQAEVSRPRTWRPAQPLSAARRPVGEAHAPSPNVRPCGGYMLGGGTFGGFMLGSGN
jgi:hypothetical protein